MHTEFRFEVGSVLNTCSLVGGTQVSIKYGLGAELARVNKQVAAKVVTETQRTGARSRSKAEGFTGEHCVHYINPERGGSIFTHPSTRLHGLTTQKTSIRSSSAMRTS
jgi:hypothetical protein